MPDEVIILNKRIDQLDLGALLNPDSWFAVFNPLTGKTERYSTSVLISSQTTGNFEWLSDYGYVEDQVVTYSGSWWQALQDNNNVTPGTDPTVWLAIVKSTSGLVPWAAGVYVEDRVFVLYDLNQDDVDPDWSLYALIAPARPFISSDFETELVAEQWRQIGGGGGGGAPAREVFDFNGSLFTEDSKLFRGLITELLGYSSDELASVTFEVRLSSVTTWTTAVGLAALQTWITANVTGDSLTGLKFWVKVLANYNTGQSGVAQYIFSYTAS